MLRVVLTGPLRSGFRVNMQRVLQDGFVGWTAAWGKARGGTPDAFGWKPSRMVQRENSMVYDVDTYAGAGLPDALAALSVGEGGGPTSPPGAVDLLAQCDALLRPFRVRSLDLRLYHFGVATVTIDARPREPWRGRAEEAVRWVETRSSQVSESGLGEWCRAALDSARICITDDFVTADGADGDEGVWRAAEPGKLLWLHRLPVLGCSGGASEASRLLDELVSGGDHDAVPCGRGPQRALLAPDIGTSLILTGGGNAAEATDCFAEVVTLQNAYWAGAQELGTVVLRRINLLAAVRRGGDTQAVRDLSDQLIDLHDEVALFRSLMADLVVRLPRLSAALWERTARAWKLDPLMTEIETRQRDLAELGDRFLARIQAAQTARLNRIVLALTLMSGVGILASLVDFSQGAAFHGPGAARVLVVALSAVILTSVVVLATFQWRSLAAAARRRRAGRRP
jgi:hypothetical protein